MEKIIKIGEQECRFKTSAAVPYLYREKFHKDIFSDFTKIQDWQKKHKGESLPPEALETFEQLAYIMHKHGDKSQPDDIVEWLEQFDTFDIYTMLPQLLELWHFNTTSTSTPKKGKSQ